MVNNSDKVSLGGVVNIAGNLNVNTNKFKVNAANGNTLVAGTLSSTGNFAVNTDKFKVLAGSGNTTAKGTLAVDGATTLKSTLAVTGNVNVNSGKFQITAASGNTSIAGTLAVTGITTLNGQLKVKATTTARHINPEAHNTYSIGTDAVRWKNLWLTSQMKSATVVTSNNATIGGKLIVNSSAVDAIKVAGKAQSASTVSTDVGATLVTKDYMQAQIDASAGGDLKAVQTGGDNNNPNLTLTLPQQGSSVQIVGGTGVSSTRNSNTKITLANTSTLKCLQTGGNNTDPTISLGGTTGTAKNVTVTGGTGIGSTRTNDSKITLTNTSTLSCTQTGGNNTNPNISLGGTTNGTKTVTITGGTGITSTRNSGSELTLGFNGYLIAEGTGGNNTDPTISLGGTDNTARKVTVKGGTGIQVDRNSNSQITVTNAGTIKAVQTSGNNANPNIQISSNQAAKNVQISGGTGINSNRTNDSKITLTVDKTYFDGLYEPLGAAAAAGQWEINGATLRPVSGANAKHVVPRATGNANLGTNALRWGTTYTNKVSAKSGDSATAPSYTWEGQEAKTGMFLVASNSLGLATNGTQAVRIYPDGSSTWRSNLQPATDGGANLGSTTLRWANVYTQDMHFSNEGTEGNSVDGTTGDWTLQEGHDHLYFINNKTGAKFRVVMEQV